MTEQEHINVTDLAKLRIIQKILYDITPENSIEVIDNEFDEVYSKIRYWIESLETIVKTDL